MTEPDQPKHRHSLTCGHGWRMVPVSLPLLSSLLAEGRATVEPINVPMDMEVVGSMTKENVFDVTGKRYPSGVVMLICVSADWPKSDEIDRNRRTYEIRTFIPEYRVKRD